MLQSTCAFKNASHKVDEISKEIQSNFQVDVPLRFKRLSKDYRGTPDAKRGLNFGGPGSSSDQNELQGKQATFMRFLLQVTGTPFKILDARQSEILTYTKILKHTFGNRLEFMSTNNKFRESLDNMYSPRVD